MRVNPQPILLSVFTTCATAGSMSDAMHIDPQALFTFAGALAIGVLLIQVAHRLYISPIILLLVGGILLGPEVLDVIRPTSLGNGFPVILALVVGIVLFEGGLSLDPKSYRSVSGEVKGIIIAGVLLTWGLTALCAWGIFRFPLTFCLLLASLAVITGPPIIGTIFKRLHVKRKLHVILHWEGVLVDPIGVFIALLCYKLVAYGGEATPSALWEFGQRIVGGALIGGLLGWGLATAIRRQWLFEDNLNIAALATAVGILALAEAWKHESGLLSVTVAGFVIGSQNLPEVKKLRAYKAELIEMLIGFLFILVAANLKFGRFVALGWRGGLLVLFVLFVVRPLVVFGSTRRSDLGTNDKLFLTWVCPRGLMAISMSSLFAISLSRNPAWAPMAGVLEAFTFGLVGVTVLLQGSTTRGVARLLKVLRPAQTGWMIVGAHRLAREIGLFIQQQGFYVVLVDQNVRNAALARRSGLPVVTADPVTLDREDYIECYGVGNLLAISEYDDHNALVCQHFRTEDPDLELYRWSEKAPEERKTTTPGLLIGRVVWRVLRLQNLRAMDLMENQKHLDVRRTTVKQMRHRDRVLMGRFGERLLPYVPQDMDGECEVITYQPFAVGIDIMIKPEWIRFTEAKNVDDIYDELLDCLKSDFPDLDTEGIHTNLIQREHEYSSLVGYDVALPHFYTKALSESVVLLAKLAEPISDIHSNQEVRYVFLLLSPEDQPKTHLQSLAEISRFIMDKENRQQLKDARDTEALVSIFFE